MKKKFSNFVSQSEFARMKGVSPQRVGQWVRDGIISLTLDRKVDVEIACQQLERRLDFGKRIDWEVTFGKKIKSEI